MVHETDAVQILNGVRRLKVLQKQGSASTPKCAQLERRRVAVLCDLTQVAVPQCVVLRKLYFGSIVVELLFLKDPAQTFDSNEKGV